MYLVGLTGGIACGKSTISRYLKSKNIPIIDADEISRIVVQPGKPAYKLVVKSFGSEILNPDKTINRAQLGSIVFGDTSESIVARKKLNSLLHPAIRREILSQIFQNFIMNRFPLVVLDAPLLFESKLNYFMTTTVSVFAPRKVQIDRIRLRDRLSVEDAEKRIDSQFSSKKKSEMAIHTIINDETTDIEDLYKQIDKLFDKLMFRARFLRTTSLIFGLGIISASVLYFGWPDIFDQYVTQTFL